jgi:hypothetical protein
MTIVLCYFIIKLNHKTVFSLVKNEKVNTSVYNQLQHLKNNRDKEEAMQVDYPEGFFFYNAIYMLTWCNIIEHLSKNHPIYLEGKKEIAITYMKLASEKATSTFHEDLYPKYGAFYNGWLAYCLGKKIQIDNKENKDEIVQFDSLCCQLLNGYYVSNSPYIKSYEQGIWPADNFACIAALNLHDKVFGNKDNNYFINKWLRDINLSLEKKDTLLPPHSIDYESGKTIEEARGCSSALILVFLSEINEKISQKYYAIYKDKYFAKRFTRIGIREYTIGQAGDGDIDSGPVILDIGAVASIVGMKAAILNKDENTYYNLMRSLELFGLPFTYNDQKKYLFGKIPMADLFIAWARSKERYSKAN